MALSSPQRTPVQRRRRRRLRLAGAAAALCVFLLVTGQIFGAAVFPLVLALGAAWALAANGVRNGRD